MIATRLSAPAAEIAASVSERELLRLLGLPGGRALEGDLLDRAEGARDWYVRHGEPFLASRRVAIGAIEDGLVRLDDGTELRSAVLGGRLASGDAHALVALCASAGPDVADEVKRLWAEERPDEAYFLDRFAVAVTERLVFWASFTLCRASEPAGETLLPHLSPGCGHWDLADQHRVMGLLTGPRHPALEKPSASGSGLAHAPEMAEARGGERGETVQLGPIELLPSGALHPQHSVLAVLGVTRRKVATTPQDLCRSCDLDPCAFRRAPFAAPGTISSARSRPASEPIEPKAKPLETR